MDLKYRLKVARSKYYNSNKDSNSDDTKNKSAMTITVKDPRTVKFTKKKCVFLCSGFEINKDECQEGWNKQFLIEPTIDGVTIEASPGFYFKD